MFAIYSLPLADLIHKHHVPFHFFADDFQLYIIFDPVGPNRVKGAKDKIRELIADVSQWLLTHVLMFNGGKTEVLFIHSKYMHLEPFPPLMICNDLVHTSLRNIAESKCYLTETSLLIVAHVFITNMMDYCNSLLFGLPNTLLYKLQHLQNSTAKLITGKQKYDHNTPELIKVHWLKVLSLKILLITFKCLNNLAPKFLRDLISIHKLIRHLQSADLVLLDMPRIR